MACKAAPGFSSLGTVPSGPPDLTVLCIGDSLTDFGSATIISWCDQSRFATTNIAVAATQSEDWVANYVAYTAGVTVADFDTVVVMLGYNDANQDPSAVAALVFASNMSTLIANLAVDGATDIMLVGPPHKVSDVADRTLETNAAVDAYVLELQTSAASNLFVRHSLALSANDLEYPSLYHDGNHPNTAGQSVWKNWFDGAIPH